MAELKRWRIESPAEDFESDPRLYAVAELKPLLDRPGLPVRIDRDPRLYAVAELKPLAAPTHARPEIS